MANKARQMDVLGAGVVLLAFVVRLIAARGIDLGFDGGLSLSLAVEPLGKALDFLARDVHPPLAYLLLRGWGLFVGTAPLAVKLGSVIPGVLTVAVVVAWARGARSRGAGALAGALVALAPAAVELSVDPREYAWGLLFMVLSARAYARWDQGGRRWFLPWSALALWSSFLAGAVLFAAASDALARSQRRGRLPRIIGAGATILPWLGFALSRGFGRTLGSAGPSQGGAAPPPLSQISELARLLSGGSLLDPPWVGPAGFGLAILALLVGLGRRSRSAPEPPVRLGITPGPRPSVRAEWPFLGLAAFASVGLAIGINTFWTRAGLPARYALAAVPFFAVAFAIGLDRAPRGARLGAASLAIVVAAAGTAAWIQRPALPSSFWAPVPLVRYLDQNASPNDVVVFMSAEQAGYYQALSAHPRPWVLISTGTDYLQGDPGARAAAELTPLQDQTNVFWLVLYRPSLGAGASKVADWLSLNAFAEATANLPDSEIDPFVAVGPASPPARGVARLHGGIHLVAADWSSAVEPGTDLPIELDWQTRHPVRRDLTVFVHLVDAEGRLWSQHDAVPENGRDPTTHWTPGHLVVDRHGLDLPRNLPPGEYWIDVGMYDQTGRLGLSTGGDTIHLGPVVVSAREAVGGSRG